jgi:hypothetical protein
MMKTRTHWIVGSVAFLVFGAVAVWHGGTWPALVLLAFSPAAACLLALIELA